MYILVHLPPKLLLISIMKFKFGKNIYPLKRYFFFRIFLINQFFPINSNSLTSTIFFKKLLSNREFDSKKCCITLKVFKNKVLLNALELFWIK